MSRFPTYIFAYASIILGSVFLPTHVFARNLWYGTITRIENNTAFTTFRDLEEEHYFSCDIITFACQKVDTIPSLTPIPDPQVEIKKSTFIFPNGVYYRTYSPTYRFAGYKIANQKKKERIIGLLDSTTGKKYESKEFFDYWNLLDEQPRIFRFSPNEKSFAYVSDRSGFTSLYIVPLTVAKISLLQKPITNLQTLGDFVFISENSLAYIANTKKNPYIWSLYIYDLTTKKKKILATDLAYDATLRFIGDRLTFNQITPLGTLPVTLTLSDNLVHQFVFPNAQQSSLENQDIIYKDLLLADMHGVLMKNQNTNSQTSPLIVWLHGGPYRQTSFIRHPYLSYGVYDWMLEQAVQSGAIVLKLDYSGSYGYGRMFAERLKNKVGKIDVADTIRAIDILKKTEHFSNVYLAGNSYGGYMVLRDAVAYPKRFNGVISINGVTDWEALVRWYKTSIFNVLFNGLPTNKNKTQYIQASIISRISRLTNQHITVLQAEKDTTIPLKQAELLKQVFDEAGKTMQLITIPDEDHVFVKKQSMEIVCAALFDTIGLDKEGKCRLSN